MTSLREVREAKGMSRSALEKKVPFQHTTLVKIESGQLLPTPKAARKTATVLGVDVHDSASRKKAVAAREGVLASDIGVGWIPNQPEVRTVDGPNHWGDFGGCREVAGVLVFQPDNEAFGRRGADRSAERFDNPVR